MLGNTAAPSNVSIFGMYFVGFIFFQILIDCDRRMANAIGTGVNVPDFRHDTDHSLFGIL